MFSGRFFPQNLTFTNIVQSERDYLHENGLIDTREILMQNIDIGSMYGQIEMRITRKDIGNEFLKNK